MSAGGVLIERFDPSVADLGARREDIGPEVFGVTRDVYDAVRRGEHPGYREYVERVHFKEPAQQDNS